MTPLLAISSGAAIYVSAGVLVVLVGISLYLGRRGGILRFSARGGGNQEQAVDESGRYLERIAQALAIARSTLPDLGAPKLDDGPLSKLQASLDESRPPDGTVLHQRHRAFSEAVASLVDIRRRSAQALETGSSLIRRSVPDGRLDCDAAARALHLMNTFSSSVDPQISEIVELCQSEKAAREEMRKRMTELDVAVYKQKYRLT